MGVAWLEDFRASLSRVLNIKGEGPPAYLPVGNELNLTYDVTDLISLDTESRSNISLRNLLSHNLDIIHNPTPGHGHITINPNSIPGNRPHNFAATNYSLNMLAGSITTVNKDNGFGTHYYLETGTYKIDIVAGIKSEQIVEAKDLVPCIGKVVGHGTTLWYCTSTDDLRIIAPNRIAATVNSKDLLVSVTFICSINEANHYVIGFIGMKNFNPDEENYVYASRAMLSNKTITYPLIGTF